LATLQPIIAHFRQLVHIGLALRESLYNPPSTDAQQIADYAQ
jgi:hypothetical protein